ncbi:hypothetical protein D3C86_2085120 [compost metagenome]
MRLHQSLAFIDFVRHLFKRIGQRFLFITLNGNDGFARQPLGDFVDAAGQFHTGSFDQVFAHILRQLGFPMRAEA